MIRKAELEQRLEEAQAAIQKMVDALPAVLCEARKRGENAGFREAADWLEAGDFYDCSSGYIIKEIRAEADRREGNVSTGEGES